MASVGSLILHATYEKRACDLHPSDCLLVKLNVWMEEHRQGRFVAVGNNYDAGPKAFEAEIYIAATNYLPEADFLTFVQSLPWSDRRNAQIWIKQSNDDRFRDLVIAPELAT